MIRAIKHPHSRERRAMTLTRNIARRAALGVVPMTLLLAGTPALAQTKDRAPVAMQSARQMSQDKPGTESWTYAQPTSVFTKYRTVIVDQTVVYTGPDAQFNGVEPADRSRFAAIVTDELRSELAKSFPAPARPQADTMRLRVTLLGATKTKGWLATATRVTPLGFATSALKSVAGRKGTFTGSLLYAVEVFDARTNELLIAAVRRRTPDPLDIPATLSTTDTVKAVAREFADGARKRLENLTQIPPRP
jgi:hypothetical protein